MMSFIRRPKAHLKIAVGDGPLHLGDTLLVTVSLEPLQDFRIRQGRLELLYIETYEEMEAEAEGISGGRLNIPRVIWTEPVFAAAEFKRGTRREVQTELFIPSNARPSSESGTLEISWALRVSLDVPLARDVSQAEKLTILPRDSGE